ncbi:hypothetical protein JG688_00014459 [Phytophthora aleatoria]|uniref:Phosphatidylinositol 3 and 4-kinase-like protein n=1 Tax=Phytophthora aleatoria TaxID=2496075 RepID=A0A8J5MDF8_9STRA|nr:hypothetical protein JG688_00014459 [Phytophthora aleatoria]
MASTANLPGVPASSGDSSPPFAITITSPPPSPTKSKLLPTPSVADILAHDGSVDVRLLMISMWKHRANASFTSELCQRLCSMPITQPMLDQVEFYLPQLAHMVVHLERELPMEDMEQFVLLLSQSSVHFALQFFWMIYAALDENPLEQCFVYGSPAARQASELLTRQSISRDEMEQILMADRRFFAAQQSSTDSASAVEDVAPISGGWLLKKGGGTRTMGRRNWTMRWCRIEKRILLVFTKPTDSQPRAAIPLHGAKVHIVENKRPFYFEIAHDFSETKAKFAAKTADELSTWVAYIQKTAALPDPPAGSPTKGGCSPERTLARMSFAMRTFIMRSSSNVTSNAVDAATVPSRSGSPSKADSMNRPAEITADDDEHKQRIENTFGELTFTKADRLQENIQCANPERWRLSGLMSKSFDDLRQEVLVMQLISYFQHVFELEKLPLRLHPYRILSTGSSTGLIEVVRNAMSLDGIKKTSGFKNLRSHFEQMYGGATNNAEGGDNAGEGAELLRQAKLNFIHSLAAYSIVCYILAIKDRHNGNIMLDIEGYIIHIDFGFFLGRAPGGSFSFETAPFKLTAEMVDVLARKHAETIYTLVEVMSYHSKLPCFVGGAAGPLSGLKERLFLNMSEKKVAPTIQSMVQRAYDHFGTNKYDQFQTFSNGIAK